MNKPFIYDSYNMHIQFIYYSYNMDMSFIYYSYSKYILFIYNSFIIHISCYMFIRLLRLTNRSSPQAGTPHCTNCSCFKIQAIKSLRF